MNCGLLSECHKHSPHIEVFHFVFWIALEVLSQIRVDFLVIWNVSTRYTVFVRPLRVVVDDDFPVFCGRFPCTFLKTRILFPSCSSEFPRTFVRFCIWKPHLRTRRCVILIWTSSGRFPCTFCAMRFEPCWLGARSFPGRFDALETGTVRELAAVCETKFNVGFDFATIISSPCSSCILFAIVLRQPAELKMLMFNRRRWLFHSSRVRLPFVSMSASWFLVSTCLIWILGSRLMNNQSSATLWVRDSCLIVGLLPWMIILITASLSSKI